MAKSVLATGGYDHSVRFWDIETGMTQRAIQFADSQVNALKFSPDGLRLAAAGNPRVSLFDVGSTNPNPFLVCDAHKGNVMSVEFESGGQWLLTASDDGTLKIWDSRSSGAKRSFSNGDPINAAVMTMDTRHALSADAAGRLRVWDLSSGRVVQEVTPQSSESLQSLALAENGLVAVSNKQGAIFIWHMFCADASSSTNTQPLDDSSKASKPAGSSVEMIPLCRLQAHVRYVLKVGWSADSRWLLSGHDDGRLKVWRIDPDELHGGGDPVLVHTLTAHQRWVWDATFRSNGKQIFSASSDKKALLWDLESGSVVREFVGHQKAITCLAVSNDGQSHSSSTSGQLSTQQKVAQQPVLAK